MIIQRLEIKCENCKKIFEGADCISGYSAQLNAVSKDSEVLKHQKTCTHCSYKNDIRTVEYERLPIRPKKKKTMNQIVIDYIIVPLFLIFLLLLAGAIIYGMYVIVLYVWNMFF